jgi:rRNA pseudouridine-1189 N-methylase Emg1 (Nep1/Mra1 family)
LGGHFPDNSLTSVVVGVGAFPHGGLNADTLALFAKHVKLDDEVMMTWHVCSEILWTYSAKIKVAKERLT